MSQAGLATSGGGGGTFVNSITGDTGLTVTGNIFLYGHTGSANAGSSVGFNGSSATELDLFVTDSIQNTIIGSGSGNQTLTGGGNTALGTGIFPNLTNGSSNVGIGTLAGAALTSGNDNVLLGELAGAFITQGSENILIGLEAGHGITTTNQNVAIGSLAVGGTNPSNSVGIGYNCLQLSTGSLNTSVGWLSGFTITSGTNNTFIGAQSGEFINSSGSYNTFLGYNSGSSYGTTESSNICIMATGTVGESNVMRIGVQGSGNGQVNQCIVAGIVGVTTSNTQIVTINSSTGQLGAATIAPGIQSWVDVSTATQALAVNIGYITDHAGGVVYTLPATASIGDEIRIMGKQTSWSIAQNATQQISAGSANSTVGVGGSVASTNLGDCIWLVCITAGTATLWRAQSFVGSLTVT